jgi:hypothetical protein
MPIPPPRPSRRPTSSTETGSSCNPPPTRVVFTSSIVSSIVSRWQDFNEFYLFINRLQLSDKGCSRFNY